MLLRRWLVLMDIIITKSLPTNPIYFVASLTQTFTVSRIRLTFSFGRASYLGVCGQALYVAV